MAVLLPLFLLSFMFTYSNAAVCVCKDANELDLQKVIDFACGGGADCAQIQTTGACYQPNTLKNHCDVAVNSYYQKKASTGATCDFNGAAVISTSPPSTTSSCLSSSRYVSHHLALEFRLGLFPSVFVCLVFSLDQ
ncbi:hypothetical protein AXX17_AT1G26800 [Arabidopsis thaliana]|uniref:X8 domain-containing protein n=1 Tax=Arabidopsis thaliana TaxID=3702 RepID=A0A178W3L2_ARATH|nr:hypothetical protein AXX17_AT1G26800 [Arabidopsis thaliana]